MAAILKHLKRALVEAALGSDFMSDARRWLPGQSGPVVGADLACELDDRYVIDNEVGRGGMAVVFLATDRRYDRRVALKVLRPDLAHDIGRSRFLREIQLAAQLSHPHILPVYDSGAVDDLLYFVMPYAEGGSLRARLNRERTMGIREALQLVREVAAALDYAHRQQVVHCDIKPENILFHEGIAMVADFGIGRVVSGAGETLLTGAGSMLGTLPYMSPEQIDAQTAVDGRSDLYSLGCVLYEMVTGMPVFSGPSRRAVVARRVSDPIPVLSFPDEVPSALQSAIRSLLAVAPADRPASGAELLRTLDHATTCCWSLCGSE